MTAIRPDLPSLPARADAALRPAAREAQAAFFRAALNPTQPVAAPRPNPVQPAFKPVDVHPAAPVEPPSPGRPGSLLDIRV